MPENITSAGIGATIAAGFSALISYFTIKDKVSKDTFDQYKEGQATVTKSMNEKMDKIDAGVVALHKRLDEVLLCEGLRGRHERDSI